MNQADYGQRHIIDPIGRLPNVRRILCNNIIGSEASHRIPIPLWLPVPTATAGPRARPSDNVHLMHCPFPRPRCPRGSQLTDGTLDAEPELRYSWTDQHCSKRAQGLYCWCLVLEKCRLMKYLNGSLSEIGSPSCALVRACMCVCVFFPSKWWPSN